MKTEGTKRAWLLSDIEGLDELMPRVRRAAHKICRGPEDYEDTVQDMILTILEAQAEDPSFAAQQPSYQVKRAWWRVRDKRRLDDREAGHHHFDIPVEDRYQQYSGLGNHDSPSQMPDWYELIEGSGPADQAVIQGLMRAEMRSAIENLAAGGDDPRGALRQELIVRRFYGEQTVEAAARAMGLPKGTACMYSAQALQHMRGRLKERGWIPASGQREGTESAANTLGPRRIRDKRDAA